MSVKPSKRKLVRLSNGAVEYQDAVSETMLALRSLSTEMSYAYCELARAVRDNKFDSISDYLAAWCRRKGLAQPTVEFKLFDDVRDVVLSSSEWKDKRPTLRPSPLHQDQTNLQGQ